MKLYFVFSAPISGPIAEWSGGLGDLDEIVKSEEEARALARKNGSRDELGHRSVAWFNSVDTDTLEVSAAEYFEP
jgi:hypothetical protein